MRKFMTMFAMVGLLVLLGQVASADVDEGTFDDDGTVSSDGRHVTTTVSFECEEGDRYKLRVSITQDETGAFAQKQIPGECTHEEMDILVEAPAHGQAVFEADDTEACALVRTRAQGQLEDDDPRNTGAEQFCEDDVNLDEEEDETD